MGKMVNLQFFKDKRVFITGNTGFKGSWLSEILLDSGANVLGYGLKPNATPNLFQILNLDTRLKTVYADIRDYGTLKKTIDDFQPEIVIHLAAQALVRDSYRDPVGTYSTNVMGTVHLLEALRNIPSVKTVLNVTTDKVYENKEWHWGYRENENLCGSDPYSNSKSCSELVTYSYIHSFFGRKKDPSVCTARSGNVIGGGDFSKDRIIPDCVRSTLANDIIKVRNPDSIRPYQHCLDCLSGYLTIIEKQYESGHLEGNFNFGPRDDDCIDTRRLVDLFCNNWDTASWVYTSDAGPHEANFLKLDISKSRTVLGWRPRWDIEKAMRATVAWYQAYFGKKDMIAYTKKQIREFFAND